MKGVTRLLTVILAFIVLFGIVPKASALVFPECRWNELSASCQCPHAYNACADNSCSNCEQYKNDARYYYLWKDIYCRKASVLELSAKYEYSFVIPFIAAVAIQLIVFVSMGYRKKEELLKILTAVLLTVLAGTYLIRSDSLLNGGIRRLGLLSIFQNPDIHFSLYGMDLSRLIFLLIVMVLMAVFETLFLIHAVKFRDRKKVLITVVTAHFVSLVLGLGILNAVYPRFMLPRIF